MRDIKRRLLKILDDKLLVDGEVMTTEEKADLRQLRREVKAFMPDTKIELDTAYCPNDDMTFVMRNTYYNGELRYRECVGWYHGAPDDKSTQFYSHGGNNLIATYDF